MVTLEELHRVDVEIERYLDAARNLHLKFIAGENSKSKETAALKRASMDLSRALVQLRITPGRVK